MPLGWVHILSGVGSHSLWDTRALTHTLLRRAVWGGRQPVGTYPNHPGC